MYFADGTGGFSFASEIKALRILVPELGEVNAEALCRYLSCLWCAGDGTAMKSIHKRGNREWLRAGAGRIVERHRWYGLPQLRMTPKPLAGDHAVSAVRRALCATVRRQMVPHPQVGALRPIVLDSGAVMEFARGQAPGIRCARGVAPWCGEPHLAKTPGNSYTTY